VVYHEQILSITFAAYRQKKIDSLKLVEADVDYSFKFSDRSSLSTLLQEKGDCDEILIVKNGCITDTSFSNVVFGKDNQFFTPDSYLLNGTKRQQLLREGKIRATRVTVENLHCFDKVYFINSMLDIEDSARLSIEKIV
jgi:4-amino-4-deoxychorismate lyase